MSEDPGSECPVCYEKVSRQSPALRTLTCHHIFCHDCLVKTVVNQGAKPSKVVCPVCRHVTFLSKPGLVTITKDKAPKQTLQIPLPAARGASGPGSASRATWRWCSALVGCCPGTPPAALSSPQPSRLFVISGRGRPMSEEELRDPAGGGVGQGPRRGRLRWILLLLGLVIVGAVVAAILPWAMSHPGHK